LPRHSGASSFSTALSKHMYGPGSTYFIIPLAIFIGLTVPLPFYALHRIFLKINFGTVVSPIMGVFWSRLPCCWCLGYLSIGINSSVFTTMLLAITSQFYLRKYRATWFRKYNYLMSAALDGGTQFLVFIATFALFGASGNTVEMPNWALNPKGDLDYCLRLT
ncbi:hypothetical protein JCM11251_002285, partial [Rhodosporidiobolus azoricus]